MSQYLTFVVTLADAARWPEALQPLFEQQFFTPVSLVGSSPRKASLDFFLSGYAIDDLFPATKLLDDGWQTNSVHISSTRDERQQGYLESIAAALRSLKWPVFDQRETEWETFDLERDVSRLAVPPLEEVSLDECRAWAEGRKRLWLKLFGTVDLACDREGLADLNNCFQFAWRCQDGSLAGWQPVLEVRLDVPDENQDRVRLCLTAVRSIWLANPNPVKSPVTLGGRMTSAIADEYVDRYAVLCRNLVVAYGSRIQDASVGVGDAFHREQRRLENAFRSRLDNCPVPLDFW